MYTWEAELFDRYNGESPMSQDEWEAQAWDELAEAEAWEED